MELPDNLKYTKEHEWVKLENGVAAIGITDYAQSQLGDIVYVELPDEGEEIKEGDTFGAVESVKSVSDCFAPVTGKIIDTNDVLKENPETINEDCYGEGWMVKIRVEDASAIDYLMGHEEYAAYIKEESA